MKHGHKTLAGALVVAALAAALALIAAGSQGALAQSGSIIYVDSDATGFNNGRSWKHAYTDLQDALDEATSGDQIWVAAGTYKPTRRVIDDDARSAAFQMVNGVAIYAGWEPDEETRFEDRDWVAHEAILSGDIGFPGHGDNSYHVFYHPQDLALDNSAILDGFSITAGNANEPDLPGGDCGGGMMNEGSSPTLRNITFKNNWAGYGGGIWVRALPAGDWAVTLTNVAFVGNSAVEGGAVNIDAAQADPGDWELTFANCIFWDNLAERGGGVAITWGEPDADTPLIRFTNCTFSGNVAAELGGAIYALGPVTTVRPLMLTNSILWGDTAGGDPNEIYTEDDQNPPLVTYSDIEGGYEGVGNIAGDPWPPDLDDWDLHLQAGSPCIDAGDNYAPDIPMVDFDGEPRIMDGDGDGWPVVDMGADEFKMPAIWVEIDVTPYTPDNIIKLHPATEMDVAILTTDEFYAGDVAPDTVVFAGAIHEGFTLVDVDDDDDLDLLLLFKTPDLELGVGTSEATLTGETVQGEAIEGSDQVIVHPGKGPK